MGSSSETAKRPGGRSARTRAAVHEAVLELLTEGDLAAVTIPAVAERSGVHNTSLYRRWGTMQGLLSDVVLEVASSRVPIANTGTLRGDLQQFARDAAHLLQTPSGAAIARTVIALSLDVDGRGRREYWARRYATLQPIFDQARARGEAVPDPEDVVEGILAPLHFRLLVTSRPINRPFLDAVVDRALGNHPT